MINDHPIFIESIKYIRANLVANKLNYLENKVLERLVHTSGDFNVQNLLEFSKDACEIGIQSLREGAPILTDTDMAAAAIKSMTENTTGNKVFSAKKWFKNYTYSGLTKTAHGLVKGWVDLASKYSKLPKYKSPFLRHCCQS